ncbi:hypothetical protein Plhal710r2_c005g0024301 [Plasmopara halstedii]
MRRVYVDKEDTVFLQAVLERLKCAHNNNPKTADLLVTFRNQPLMYRYTFELQLLIDGRLIVGIEPTTTLSPPP